MDKRRAALNLPTYTEYGVNEKAVEKDSFHMNLSLISYRRENPVRTQYEP